MKTADDILGAWNVLRNRYQDRDLRYKACWYAYNGDFDKITPTLTTNKLKDIRQNRSDKIQVWNMVYPFVEAKRALTSRLPAIEVPAPKMGDPLAAQFAEKQERLHYCLWDNSQMKKKHAKAAFNTALWNSTTWFVRWDQEKNLPVITVRKPGETYPVFKRSGDEVAYCLFVFKMDEDEVAEQYPEAKNLLTKSRKNASFSSSVREIEVIEYVDADQYGLVINGDYASLVQGGETKVGFCPVIVTPGSYVEGDDGEFFPPSGIEQVVSINDLMNRFQTKWHDALEETLRPGAILKGPNVENKVWDQGPGAINYLDVDEEYAPPQYPNLPSEVFIHIQRMEQIMRTIANVPESASGQMDASIITGQAVKRLQGVMTAVAAETNDSFTNGLTKCNEWMLRMLEKYRPQERYTLYSSDSVTPMSRPGKKDSIQVSIVPAEDINKYYRNRLVYSPLGMDTGLALTLGMQLVEADVVSRRWLRNQISGLGDAEGMETEINEEKRKRLQLEVDLQTLAYERMQSAQGGQPTGGQVQGEAAGGAQEGAAPSSAPESGVAPPPQGGPAPTVPQPQQIGTTMVMPGGQPSMMGMGEPASGKEGFPIPYTPLKPFNEALRGLSQEGVGQPEPGQGPQGEALPGRNVVTADEIVAALNEYTNRKGEKMQAKLKGKVYLLGEIAQRGWTDGEIEFGITAKVDQQVIVAALPQYASERRLSFRVIAAGATPPDAMLISGGAQQEQPMPVGVS